MTLINRNKFSLLSILFAAPITIWCALLLYVPSPLAFVSDYIAFFFLGITGAIFANATGAGGGVVFIPAFDVLGFDVNQAVATSFAIQCMGMTTGAIAWSRYYRSQCSVALASDWSPFISVIMAVAPGSVFGLWAIYYNDIATPFALAQLFAGFSIILGVAILVISFWFKPNQTRRRLQLVDAVALLLIGLLGGAITAWLSVGVGEIMAVYLILRSYSAVMAVASAVVVSAITVLAGIAEHTILNPHVFWQVLFFAGPGAVIGAVLARYLASHLPVQLLKIFFAVWILLMGLGSLFVY